METNRIALPVFRNGIEGAVKEVLDFGRSCGREKAIVLDGNGRVLLKKEGCANCVEFEDWELEEMEGGVLVHNHPVDCALSPPDLALAGRWGAEIWAVCGDGGVYVSNGVRPGDYEIAQRVQDKVDDFLTWGFVLGKLEEGEADVLAGHLFCLGMRKLGALEYWCREGRTLERVLTKVKGGAL